MGMVDLREIDRSSEVVFVLESGEEFDGYVADIDGDDADNYSAGWKRLTVEGKDFWEQVNDRVDSEVLHARQEYARKTGRPKDAVLQGTVWPEPAETSEPKDKLLGVIDEVKA